MDAPNYQMLPKPLEISIADLMAQTEVQEEPDIFVRKTDRTICRFCPDQATPEDVREVVLGSYATAICDRHRTQIIDALNAARLLIYWECPVCSHPDTDYAQATHSLCIACLTPVRLTRIENDNQGRPWFKAENDHDNER